MSYHSRDNFDSSSNDLPFRPASKAPTIPHLLKSMLRVADARRRIRLEEFTPQHKETAEELRARVEALRPRKIARISECCDTDRIGIAWMEPAFHYSGDGSGGGLVLVREDIDLRAGTTSGAYPFAGISWHAMGRLAERSDVVNLDHMERAAAAGLSWSHVARLVACHGEYHVPHTDGVFCCLGLPEGIVDSDGRTWPSTLIKTWVNNEEMAYAMRMGRDELLHFTRAKAPFFPGFNDIDEWQALAFPMMRDAGRRREHIRENGYGVVNDERFAPWQAA